MPDQPFSMLTKACNAIALAQGVARMNRSLLPDSISGRGGGGLL